MFNADNYVLSVVVGRQHHTRNNKEEKTVDVLPSIETLYSFRLKAMMGKGEVFCVLTIFV